MISAIMFDLDGTLVQSEKLKALSYAMAIQRLRGLPEPEARAIEAYREIVGAARDVASRHVMDSLQLEPELQASTIAARASRSAVSRAAISSAGATIMTLPFWRMSRPFVVRTMSSA